MLKYVPHVADSMLQTVNKDLVACINSSQNRVCDQDLTFR
jgi:hypothetical protein